MGELPGEEVRDFLERISRGSTSNAVANYFCVHRVMGEKPLCQERGYTSCPFKRADITIDGRTEEPIISQCPTFVSSEELTRPLPYVAQIA